MEEVNKINENIKKNIENKKKIDNKKNKERNDINEKYIRDNIEKEIANVIIMYYSNAKTSSKDTERFVKYIRHIEKENKSNNSFSNRTYSLYQYLTEQFSNFTELDRILK